MNVRVGPARRLRGSLVAPPDKSISHRAAILAALADGETPIQGYLDAADTRSTLAAVAALGARVERRREGLVVAGVGLRGAREPDGAIDVGNAGTLLRLLPGWLAGQEGRAFTLDGDASIRRRPVDRVAAPLRAMGADIEATEGRFAPLRVRGAPLHGGEQTLAVASAQVKSCLLLAGLLAEGATTLIEPAPSRDHTERMLAALGARVTRDGARLTLEPAEILTARAWRVPGDPSSAAFPLAAAALVPGSRVTVRGVGTNWTRIGFLRILERMGARVEGELEERGRAAPDHEPVGDLTVSADGLRATEVQPDEVPLAIDELPLVALLGCFAEGETIVRGAGELRVKESDRIAAVVDGLRGLGGELEATADGFAVQGTAGLRGGALDAHGDHRLAILGAVAGLASREGVEVVGAEAAAVSYPDALADLAALRG
ncbi:MAG: 3-phosphoshikimate 1-carboxyvinyltransferase [Actinomycetota bacterium]|nr:3-phosphoshikimate 1-carboxyvinyltransferase [Actinomycetota bacterium]